MRDEKQLKYEYENCWFNFPQEGALNIVDNRIAKFTDERLLEALSFVESKPEDYNWCAIYCSKWVEIIKYGLKSRGILEDDKTIEIW